ncbi:unnamed protein product [Dimorphilus gyrociliatus]|uniref:Uncharacterized protein n=1 Tax=Dimorphilus gyrociliatus TaxID=2664684 RepID=A0A7I8WDX8_9ANNE|nr:unnamed protein product [Dimorphilus gyrociliatus]
MMNVLSSVNRMMTSPLVCSQFSTVTKKQIKNLPIYDVRFITEENIDNFNFSEQDKHYCVYKFENYKKLEIPNYVNEMSFIKCNFTKDKGKELCNSLENGKGLLLWSITAPVNKGDDLNYFWKYLLKKKQNICGFELNKYKMDESEMKTFSKFIGNNSTKQMIVLGNVDLSKNGFENFMFNVEKSKKCLSILGFSFTNLNCEEGYLIGESLKKMSNFYLLDLTGNDNLGKSMENIFLGLRKVKDSIVG